MNTTSHHTLIQKSRWCVLALVLSLFSSLSLAGHGGHRDGMHGPDKAHKRYERMARKLDFSDEQRQALDRLLADHSVQVKPMLRELREVRKEMHAGFSTPLAEGEVTQLSRRIGDITGALTASKMQTHNGVLALLTEEQRRELAAFADKRRDKKRR